MTRFTAIDLARLPAMPRQAKTFEEYRAAYMADLIARLAARGIAYNVQSIKSDTYAVTGEAGADRMLLVAQSIDDAVAAVLLPTSYGAYLDLLGATQDPPVQRNPGELDDPYRARIQLAPEALSTCGPEGAYLWYALAVPGVLAAGAYGPMSYGGTRASPFTGLGEVRVPVLATAGDGTADAVLVAAVAAALTARDRRPIADFVTVTPAVVVPYALALRLRVGPGADPLLVGRAAIARLRALADLQHRPGGAVLAQDLYAAAKVPDVAGRPLVGYVDLGAWTDVNAVPITPAAPGCAYAAPWCDPGTGDPVVTTLGAITTLTRGAISVAVEVVDD